ncbi:MAG: transaldolase [Candidatus Roizmanbacteria bacterium]|nr:MAG: transaldolase [Candidatus Roizmanbacteria bacterium]
MSIKLPKIFLDSGNPEETKRAKGLLGHIDGQTTNPSLVAKHPEAQRFLSQGKKLTEEELLKFYRQIIEEIGREIAGSISVEVYADWDSTASQMLKQAEKMFTWGRNIHIKFPTTEEGLKAASEFTKNGGRVNMTLVFNQTQAAASYAATLQSKETHFVSPFIGRLDDRGVNGLDLVKNIIKLYRKFNKQDKSNILVLAASIRTLQHLYSSIFMGADVVTIPFKIAQEWVKEEKWMPDKHYRPSQSGLKYLKYEDLAFYNNFEKYKIPHIEDDLLDEGLKKFVADWKSLAKI